MSQENATIRSYSMPPPKVPKSPLEVEVDPSDRSSTLVRGDTRQIAEQQDRMALEVYSFESPSSALFCIEWTLDWRRFLCQSYSFTAWLHAMIRINIQNDGNNSRAISSAI
jgi:hypothetical protein